MLTLRLQDDSQFCLVATELIFTNFKFHSLVEEI